MQDGRTNNEMLSRDPIEEFTLIGDPYWAFFVFSALKLFMEEYV